MGQSGRSGHRRGDIHSHGTTSSPEPAAAAPGRPVKVLPGYQPLITFAISLPVLLSRTNWLRRAKALNSAAEGVVAPIAWRV